MDERTPESRRWEWYQARAETCGTQCAPQERAARMDSSRTSAGSQVRRTRFKKGLSTAAGLATLSGFQRTSEPAEPQGGLA